MQCYPACPKSGTFVQSLIFNCPQVVMLFIQLLKAFTFLFVNACLLLNSTDSVFKKSDHIHFEIYGDTLEANSIH